MKRDKSYGNGLTRLADPEPEVWLKDKSQIMQVTRVGGWITYGNFWASPMILCRILPHKWIELGETTDCGPEWPGVIARCQRCGSQINPLRAAGLPVTGTW